MADMLAQDWQQYGFDEVEMPAYKVLLSYPEKDKPNMISVVDSNGTVVKHFTEQFKVTYHLFKLYVFHYKAGIWQVKESCYGKTCMWH